VNGILDPVEAVHRRAQRGEGVLEFVRDIAAKASVASMRERSDCVMS
jgi:hypothetical protein